MNEEKLADYKVDKTGWDDGPWMTEPDRVQWTHAGFACLVLRHPRHGFFCGYVAIDVAHPFYGKHPLREDLPIDTHRGLNYGAKCDGLICHVPEPGMPDDVWWLGFDLGHVWDIAPGLDARLERSLGLQPIRSDIFKQQYRTIDYAKRATEELADELRATRDLNPEG